MHFWGVWVSAAATLATKGVHLHTARQTAEMSHSVLHATSHASIVEIGTVSGPFLSPSGEASQLGVN